MQVIFLLAGMINAFMDYRKIENVLQSRDRFRKTSVPAIWSIDMKTRRRSNYMAQMSKLMKENKIKSAQTQ